MGDSKRSRVTLAVLAAELGVARSTVSNAYNRPDQLSKELRQRVLETAARLGYAGPDPVARSLRRRRAGVVGMLYADRLSFAFIDPTSVLFLQGLTAATEEAGLGLLLIPSLPRGVRNPAAVKEAAVDGLVIYSMANDDLSVEAALTRRLPCVVVDNPRLSNLPYVGIDDEGGARAAAQHLLDLGHRRVAVAALEAFPGGEAGFLTPDAQAGIRLGLNRARLAGYREALEAAGVAWSGTPVYSVAEHTLEEAKGAARQLLGSMPRPSAILAMSDLLALGVILVTKELGLRVPEDLSVVGFDGTPLGEQVTPPITTVHQPSVEKGMRAGQLLIAQLRGEVPPPMELFPTHLVVRGSTAPLEPT